MASSEKYEFLDNLFSKISVLSEDNVIIPPILSDFESFFNWIPKDFCKDEAKFYLDCFSTEPKEEQIGNGIEEETEEGKSFKNLDLGLLYLNKNFDKVEISESGGGGGDTDNLGKNGEIFNKEDDTEKNEDKKEEEMKKIVEIVISQEKNFFKGFVHATRSFLYGYLNMYEESKEEFKAADELMIIQNEHFNKELNLKYLNELSAAANYILKGVIIYINLMQNKVPKSSPPPFSEFTKEEKLLILYCKYNFQVSRKQFDQRVQTLEKLIELEPTAQRYYMLYFFLRIIRRHNTMQSKPGAKEIEAISKAWCLDKNRKKFKVANCICMGEILKNSNLRDRQPIEFNGIMYDSPTDVVNYMKQFVDELLCSKLTDDEKEDPDSSYIYSKLAELFSSVLPKQFYDFPLSEKLIQRALEIEPDGTQINHRMAVFLIKANKNYEKAIVHLEKSMEASETNFYARLDYLHIKMRNILGREGEIREFFDKNLAAVHLWSKNEIGQLLFYKGLFHAVLNEFKTAIKLWVEAYTKKERNYFENVNRQIWRFEWDNDMINFFQIEDEVKNYLKKSDSHDESSEEWKTLIKILDHISIECKRLNSMKKQQPQNRHRVSYQNYRPSLSGRKSEAWNGNNNNNQHKLSWRRVSNYENSSFLNANRRRAFSEPMANDPTERNWRAK